MGKGWFCLIGITVLLVVITNLVCNCFIKLHKRRLVKSGDIPVLFWSDLRFKSKVGIARLLCLVIVVVILISTILLGYGHYDRSNLRAVTGYILHSEELTPIASAEFVASSILPDKILVANMLEATGYDITRSINLAYKYIETDPTMIRLALELPGYQELLVVDGKSQISDFYKDANLLWTYLFTLGVAVCEEDSISSATELFKAGITDSSFVTKYDSMWSTKVIDEYRNMGQLQLISIVAAVYMMLYYALMQFKIYRQIRLVSK